MTLAALDRVKLTEDARSRFHDIGNRDGVVQRMDAGWVVIVWRGLPGERRVPEADVEPA